MSIAIENKKKNIVVTVVKKLRDYSEDPFFRKKAEKTKAFLKKNGLPKRKKSN